MKRLLFIFSLSIVVYGEAPADPGYAYPPPLNGDTSLAEETPIEDINRFIYFFKSPADQKKPPPPKPPVKPPPPKKNYKIIFIKTPEAPVPPVPPVPLPPRSEDKTIVYVLSKKPEEQVDVVLPTPPSTKPPAPEVYFINYGLKKDTGADRNSGYDYSSQSESTQAPISKPLIIPNEYLPPKESRIPEVSKQTELAVHSPSEIPSEAPRNAPFPPPKDQYDAPQGRYSSHESTNTAQSSSYSSSQLATNVASSSDSSSHQEPLNLPNAADPPAQRDTQKVPTSFASQVASQYGPPQKKDAPPPPPPQAAKVYLPPKADVAFSLSSKASSSIDEFGRYLPPSTSYGVPDPGIRLSRSSRYSAPRRTRKVYEEADDPTLDIIKGVYQYYGP